MKKLMLLLTLCFSIVACSGTGPTVQELDTMNKKMTYMYEQAESIVAAANNMVELGLINDKDTYDKVDNAISDMFKAIDIVEQSTNLSQMVINERNFKAAVMTLRTILVEIAKKQGEQDAKRDTFDGFTYSRSYG